MTEREDFDLQRGSAAQASGEKCAEGRQNRGRREPAQVSHFRLHPSLRDAKALRRYRAAIRAHRGLPAQRMILFRHHVLLTHKGGACRVTVERGIAQPRFPGPHAEALLIPMSGTVWLSVCKSRSRAHCCAERSCWPVIVKAYSLLLFVPMR
jgi:hypothetical protein